MNKLKICFKCLIEKPLSEFYKHPQMQDGHLGKCKECTKLDAKNYQVTDAGRASQRKRNQKPKRKAYNEQHSKEWQKRNPEKRQAHNKVNSALRRGKIIKPDACEECFAEGVKLHGHHEDYSKPLEVIWLCVPCHGLRNPKHKKSGVLLIAQDRAHTNEV